jgi:hypothetical protein
MDRDKWDTWDKQYGEAQIEKWINGIDLRTAIDSEIQEYASTKLYEYMDCNRRGYGYDTWFFFWEDFNHFITKDFDRLGQNYLKELRSQLKETYRPLTNAEFERLLAIIEAVPVDTNEPPKTDSFTFEALPIEAYPIEALPLDTGTNEPPETDSFALEALSIEALPVETNELAIPVEIDEPN